MSQEIKVTCFNSNWVSNTGQVFNTIGVSTWYQLTGYDAVSDIIASAISESRSLDSVEVGHGIYCFNKMKNNSAL